MKAVLEESAIPRKPRRRFERYHEAGDIRESRLAVVILHHEGWADKSIADYMGVDRSTVYRVRKRFEEHGEEGLEDRPVGRPKGVQKVDLRAMVEVLRMQENPELGEFRVQAALEQESHRRRLPIVHLESLGIDHRDARSRGIPVVPRGDAGRSLRAPRDRVPRPVRGSLLEE